MLQIVRARVEMRPAPKLFWRSGMNRSEERRVGKECRSLCDWSSDVCSSDLVTTVVSILRELNASDSSSASGDAPSTKAVLEVWDEFRIDSASLMDHNLKIPGFSDPGISKGAGWEPVARISES